MYVHCFLCVLISLFALAHFLYFYVLCCGVDWSSYPCNTRALHWSSCAIPTHPTSAILAKCCRWWAAPVIMRTLRNKAVRWWGALVDQRTWRVFRLFYTKMTPLHLGLLYKYSFLPCSFLRAKNQILRERNSNPRERSSQELTFTQPNHFPWASSIFLASSKHGLSWFLWLGNLYMF